jgi:diadenosine tetraphosphate (Ap4A) HIT family hydrolase
MEDKILFPWILLIPRRRNIIQVNHLIEEDQVQLMKEISLSSNVMEKLFTTDRLNIAAIGNKTPQLHIHIISRRENDPLWPETVWGQKMAKLTEQEANERLARFKKAFGDI